eukprot:3152653-Pyramimonas_sp.AAC.1
MGVVVSFDCSWRPGITRRIQSCEQALGHIIRGIIPRKNIKDEFKVRYVEALAFSRLFQQIEIWHELGEGNESRLRAAYMRGLRMATGLAHNAGAVEHHLDEH